MLWKKGDVPEARPLTVEAYTDAANKCIRLATALIEYSHWLANARRNYELQQKQNDLARVRQEVDALRLVVPLLLESTSCQIEHISRHSDIGSTCGKRAVAECVDCGTALCSDCGSWCCGQPFCEVCREYHVTRFCLKKPVHNERHFVASYRAG